MLLNTQIYLITNSFGGVHKEEATVCWFCLEIGYPMKKNTSAISAALPVLGERSADI